jgi:2-polyprenyl-6-methoxyphenol hydroxylase-like FAD-dependent oxidoreductase
MLKSIADKRSLWPGCYSLVKMLYEVIEEPGVKIIYGCHITDIDELRPAVHFEDRIVMEADLIVGADSNIPRRSEAFQFSTLTCVSRNSLFCTRCHP